MNNFAQQEVELTEVTVNQEVFDLMNINDDLVTENTAKDSTVDIVTAIPENNPPLVKAASLNIERDLTKKKKVKKTKKSKIIVKKEVNVDEIPANFRALTLNEVIDLWSELSQIPIPECKCTSKNNKK